MGTGALDQGPAVTEPTAPPGGASLAFGQFVSELRYDDLPAEVVAKTSALLLDFVGAAFAGSRVPEVATIIDLVRSRGGHGTATVIGRDLRLTVPDAAYANGCAGDALEHQDGYRFGGFHPSHAIPAVLAVAEDRDRSLRDLVVAVVAAYEVANRIGRTVHPQATVSGWFPIAAGYGSAAGCATLFGLDASQVASALGAANFFVPAVLMDGIFAGDTVKPAFAGQIARAGVEASCHAAAGLTGWPHVLDAPRGVVALLGGDPENPALTSGLGSEWTILEVHQKLFAGCRHTHGAAQACVALATSDAIDPRDVTNIDVETYDVALTLVDRPVTATAPTTLCTLSLPYVAAAALVDGRVSGEQYDATRISDPLIQQVAKTVHIRSSEEMNGRYPEFTATRVTITTRDGQQHQQLVDLPAGDRRAPLTEDDLLGKFHGYADPRVGRSRADTIVELLLDPAERSTARDLTALLSAGTDVD